MSARRCGPSQQLPSAAHPAPTSGAPSTTGGRRSTATGAVVYDNQASGMGTSGGGSMLTRCAMEAGMSPSLASGTSSQTTPVVEGGKITAGVSGDVASDMAASSASPLRRPRVAPESASRISTVLTVTGTGIALVSNSS